MQPKVSIVIPSLNSKPYIQRCIQSVLRQTLKDIELICVDANSTDGTLEYLKSLEQRDSRLRVIVSNIKSYGYQMNLGIEAMRGEYLGIVESDDYIKPNMYERLYEVAKEQDCEVLKCDLESFWTKNNFETIFNYEAICYDKTLYGKLHNKKEYESAGALQEISIALVKKTWNMNQPGLYSANFLKKFALKFNESAGASYQDLSFWFMMQVLAQKIYFLNEAYYYYRRDNENSSVHNKAKVYCICEEYEFMRKFLDKYPDSKAVFLGVLAYLRYGSYFWNLNRIDEEYKLEFLYRFQSDFLKIIEKNELDKSLFKQWQLANLEKILQDPKEYYFEVYCKPFGAVNRVKNQLSYKLGNTLLQAKSPLKILKLPFRLIKLILEHILDKNNPALKPNALENYRDYEEALGVKEHLSYKLGEALLKNPFTFVFKINKIYKDFKKGQY